MTYRALCQQAIEELARNPEQLEAVHAREHCVVLAGPGSGKTKTLTTAMARCLLDEVPEPRGIACITYNTECAVELESRLARLGVERSERVFVGTVHSFALTQVILPYARCTLPEVPAEIRVANKQEISEAVEAAHAQVIGEREDVHERWRFAQTKRRTILDRRSAAWKDRNPELAAFVEAYEACLRGKGLIDFEDMPLLALRIVREHEWVRSALRAKFPILFVDEYQDLGYALHDLVQLLCFEGGMRLFAVGDADQSIYGFNDAEPALLDSLSKRGDVRTIKLRFNYRCGTRIIDASQAALGEERSYRAPDGAEAGLVKFYQVEGELENQADFVVDKLVPSIQASGVLLGEIAVLYRDAWQGTRVADVAQDRGLPFIRSDKETLVPRSVPHARFVEACAYWAAGGWRGAAPPFRRLLNDAVSLVYAGSASDHERRVLELELISFLKGSFMYLGSAYAWLSSMRSSLIAGWRTRVLTKSDEWDVLDRMIERTVPGSREGDVSVAQLGGLIDGTGRLNLSTLHSAKGREFDAVILFGMNNGILPHWKRDGTPKQKREARRLFYVGVTRAKKMICLVFKKGSHSPWVAELYQRAKAQP